MRDHDDPGRTLGDLARLGTVASVDLAAARITVKAGDLVTGPIPWSAGHANSRLRLWSPPEVGEQVLLLAPEGEISGAVALPAVFADPAPPPASDAADALVFADGAVLRYSAADGLTITLPGAVKLTITAPGGVAIDADVTVTGSVTAQGDVIGQGTSLHGHKHSLVKAGTDQSGVPA
ncbi:MAG: phage baseplate assembly protein V [Sphingomonadaceae bacterium]|nr:phage baseplate assembly protein V [Sphingomonadaceae bacterium]